MIYLVCHAFPAYLEDIISNVYAVNDSEMEQIVRDYIHEYFLEDVSSVFFDHEEKSIRIVVSADDYEYEYKFSWIEFENVPNKKG